MITVKDYCGREWHHPEFHEYHGAMTEVAREAKVRVQRLYSGSRKKRLVRLRWRAWDQLNRQGFSVSGIAKASGYDHTTILSGLKRLREAGDVENA